MLEWLNGLRPAVPMSVERPCCVMSGAELRRHVEQGAVVVNGVAARLADEVEPGGVESLVFFPRSRARRTTLW